MESKMAEKGLPDDLVEKMSSLGNVTGIDGEAACKTLPDELVERIIAMMPFPAIFKARCLCKSWLARLSSVSAIDTDASKRLATAFQRQVAERSSNWDTFLSAYTREMEFFGYNRASQIWRRMPALSFLPIDAVSVWDLQIEGPLLWILRPAFFINESELYVANILTRSWKCVRMCPRPPSLGSPLFQKLVIDTLSQAYKVILSCEDNSLNNPGVSVQIYDSKPEAWSIDLFDGVSGYPTTAAYLNRVLYMTVPRNPKELLAYKLEERTLERFPLLLDFTRSVDESIEVIHLVVYKGDLLIIVAMDRLPEWHLYLDRFDVDPADVYEETQLVLRVDLQLGRLLLLSEGPPGDFEMRALGENSVKDGKCIIFGMEGGEQRRVLQCNIDSEQWSHVQPPRDYEWLNSCFQPGMCPFIAV